MRNVILFFIGIFLLTQALGLYVGAEYINLIRVGAATPAFENPESIENSFILIFYILATTGIIILVIKFKRVLLKVIEALAIFFASSVTFCVLFPVEILYLPVCFFLSLALTLWKVLKPNAINQNLAVIFSISGAGALLGASLGFLPVLIFIIALCVYDFVSVFVTKHMKYIAKEISKTPTAFSAAFPYKFKKPIKFQVGKRKLKKRFHIYQLGGGDLAIPLVFSVSVLKKFSLLQSIASILGALIALCLTIYFVLKKPGRALPALPWISSGMLLGFLISLI